MMNTANTRNYRLKKRNINLDVIRCVALFNVIAVHYLSYTGYYQMPIESGGGYLFTLVRVIFITCVPLFLMLSGFLCYEKKLSKKYYYGIFRIIFSYILVGITCQLIEIIFNSKSIGKVIISFFDFTAAPYGWYIGMYIGLFLLIPFINIMWDALDLIGKRTLLVSLLALTALPCLTNSFNFNMRFFWRSTQTDHTLILPEYFSAIYPITYYVIGCYIKTRESEIRKTDNKKILICLILSTVIFGSLNFFKNYGMEFSWALDTSYGSYQSVVIATLIFIYIYKLKFYEDRSYVMMTVISKCSLIIYLFSYLGDKFFYHFYNGYVVSDTLKLILLIPAVSMILLGTLIISYPINEFVDRIVHLIKKN